MSEFVHLHGHSYYSNWLGPDALCSPEELVKRAKEIGLTSICLTDHASISGAPSLFKTCKAEGIKPIIGAELYVTNDLAWRPKDKTDDSRRKYKHLVALAMNWDGVVEIMQLLSLASSDDHFFYKPRNSIHECAATKNIIFLTACAGGLLSDDDYEKDVYTLLTGVGKDRLFLEIQPHCDDGQRTVNTIAFDLFAKYGIDLVATQDFHYARADQAQAHEVLLAVGQNKGWTDPGRWKYPVNDLYVKSTGEMIDAFKRQAGGNLDLLTARALFNTTKIADRLNVEWKSMPISLPKMSADASAEVLNKCVTELKKRGLDKDPVYVNRLAFEYDVLVKAGFMDYFLILHDVIDWSRKRGIMVGPGRGSSGGSLLCYLLDIVQIDPIQHGLLFERFYRPGRIDLPDIDTDFEDERREEVLSYLRQKYGNEHVAGVSNYMFFAAKSAIAAAGKCFGLDFYEINAASRLVEDGLGVTVDQIFGAEPYKALFAKNQFVEPFARQLVDRMRGIGQHAAGIVIAGVPISERAAVWRKDERYIVNWDKDTIESLGLMKLDVLGLRTLSILRNAAEYVKASRGITIDFPKIPLDDAKTLQVFQDGKTTGVFQFESFGMRALLKSLKVNKFMVIADANALYRPGPMDLIPKYTIAQTGRTAIEYDHPILETVLKDTYGVLVYQEQFMEVFRVMGGFTLPEADLMRKIASKKLGPDEFAKHEGKFVAGALAKGVDEATSKRVFKQMIEWANYGFNKSHAVAYSVIAFWCAYVKANYPAEFYAAHISNSNEGQSEMAVEEARKEGIKLMMPDVNRSHDVKYLVIDHETILAPLSAIKGLGPKQAFAISAARKGELDHNGNDGGEGFDPTHVRQDIFTSEADFEKRVYKRVVNSKVRDLLDRVGATEWSKYSKDDIYKARLELMGHIFKDSVSVPYSDDLKMDVFIKNRLSELMAANGELAKKTFTTATNAFCGSAPKVMMVFEKASWKDVSQGEMAYDDLFNMVRKIMADDFGMDRRHFYVTALYKMKRPPGGYESVTEEAEKILNEEIDVTKPPVIIAFGKQVASFFAGKEVSINEMNGRVIMRGQTPIICAINPYQVVKEPGKIEQLQKFADTLRQMYV